MSSYEKDSEAVLGVWLPAPLSTPRALSDHGAIWPLAVGVGKGERFGRHRCLTLRYSLLLSVWVDPSAEHMLSYSGVDGAAHKRVAGRVCAPSRMQRKRASVHSFPSKLVRCEARGVLLRVVVSGVVLVVCLCVTFFSLI